MSSPPDAVEKLEQQPAGAAPPLMSPSRSTSGADTPPIPRSITVLSSPPSGGNSDDIAESAFLRHVIPPWKTFRLDSRRPALDKSAADLVSGRKRASSSRRKLGESPKKFKRILSETPKGCRASDNGFLGLYRCLYAVADPVQPLERAAAIVEGFVLEKKRWAEEKEGLLARAASAPAATNARAGSGPELARLRAEITDYENEFRLLKNQDITIRKLEASLSSLRDDMRSQVDTAVAAAQKDAEESAAARVADALGRERAARAKEEGARTELRAERAARAALESDVAGSTADGQAVERARAAERGVLLGDAERAREEAREAAAERDWWRMKAQ